MQHSLQSNRPALPAADENHPAIINPSRAGKNSLNGMGLLKIL
ncbi:hypothetical protein [Pseudomonas sp. PSKL.D1]|nr:hypothetical protein [Pseudomonas sp. PSKL.D1]WDY56745.1 hypothetical protein PVV54_19480 [Pseudomonas sp. PSKL.D1]